MGTATLRAFLIIAFAVWFAACAKPPVHEPASDTLRTALPPADLPAYGKGDLYTLDNPIETWRVIDVADNLVRWENGQGNRQETMFDPLLPPVRWSGPRSPAGSRKFLEWSGGLFPITPGNKLTFKTAVSGEGTPGHARFIWNCHVGHPRQVTVPAGNFAAFPVFCRRNDGAKTNAYYAPALSRPIAITATTPQGKTITRQLLAYEQGKGPRVAASRHESLPGGWSVAALAGRSGTKYPGSRIPAAQLTAVGSRLSFAGTPDANATPPKASEPGKPDRTRAAERNSAGKPLKSTLDRPIGAHIGSFRTRERAERGWTLFRKQYGDSLASLSHRVVPITLPGTKEVLYRVIVGPLDTAPKGSALCARIRQKGGYCRVLPIPKG